MHVEPSPGEPVQALTVLDNENLVWALTMLLGESASRRETNPSQMKIGGELFDISIQKCYDYFLLGTL
jgi:hypothetical protein